MRFKPATDWRLTLGSLGVRLGSAAALAASSILAVSAASPALAAHAEAQPKTQTSPPEMPSEKLKCIEMTNQFCSQLWSPENLGNLDVKISDSEPPFEIRFGETRNSIPYSRLFFLQALEKTESKFPKDVRRSLKENDYYDFIRRYQKRAAPQDFTMKEFRKEIWNINPIDKLGRVLWQTASERLDTKSPGFLTTPQRDVSPAQDQASSKELDLIYSEFLSTVWQDDPKWKKVEILFETIRGLYFEWLEEEPSIPAELKAEFLSDLKALKLVRPGSNLRWARSDCGISDRNAFYTSTDHEITVCAGTFTTGSAFQTISHEIAHSFGIQKRILDHLAASPYGQTLMDLYKRVDSDKHLTCDEWTAFRSKFSKAARATKPYVYLDEKMLSRFLNRRLSAPPSNKELATYADRYAKRVSRSFGRSNFTADFLKNEEILRSGKRVPNTRYMKATLSRKWASPAYVLDNEWDQFTLFATEAYNCALENKIPDPKALEQAIEEAQELMRESWKVLLTVAGKYSYLSEATTEGYAQEIDEDLADAIASSVVARALRKIENKDNRRNFYFAAIAGYCEEPSFEEAYPAEARLLQRVSNRPHSTMSARRENFFSTEIRAALQCR